VKRQNFQKAKVKREKR